MSGRGEFDLIAGLFAPLAAENPGALGLRDDAALVSVPKGFEIVTTVDAMVEGVHFSSEDPADLVARKLLRVNLSDLAAMAAEPVCYLLTLVCPPHIDVAWLERFVSGLARDQQYFDIQLAGGDTVATSGPLVFSLTAMGQVEKGRALQRRGASVGDDVWVSGTIGDATLGLALVMGTDAFDVTNVNQEQRNNLVGTLQLPEPRLDLGRSLAGIATAAVDISDGLFADLGHLATAGNVGLSLVLDRLPMSDAAKAVVQDGAGRLKLATGGEDYELAFTSPAKKAAEIADLAKRSGVALTVIGKVVREKLVSIVDDAGNNVPVPRSGYTHF